MRKRLFCLLLSLICLAFSANAAAVSLSLEGAALPVEAALEGGVCYVPLRAAAAQLAPGAAVRWAEGRALVESPALRLSARPGDLYMEANGRFLYAPQGIRLIGGRVWVPLRALAKAFGAGVIWEDSTQTALLSRGSGGIQSGSSFYDPAELFWLARIIEAEAGGESLQGKIAVGSVVLNRVESPAFPGSVYGVVFDRNWGVQFEPVANGTVYNSPSADSVLAAKLSLDGARPVGASLYFFNPDLAQSSWIAENRVFCAAIGGHLFYL